MAFTTSRLRELRRTRVNVARCRIFDSSIVSSIGYVVISIELRCSWTDSVFPVLRFVYIWMAAETGPEVEADVEDRFELVARLANRRFRLNCALHAPIRAKS
jgi:hypothetical protein